MIEESDIDGVEYVTEEPTVDQPVRRKVPAKAVRLIAIALLALVAVVAAIALTPSLRKEFLPKQAKASASSPVVPSQVHPDPPPAVPVAWERLNLAAMSNEASEDLRLGRYYYDRRQPGNFGLAVHHWKQALTHTRGTNQNGVQTLVTSAEIELARQFSKDSADAYVLIKQGKRDDAVALLEKMRANYLDITAPQYIWASVMLSRRRR